MKTTNARRKWLLYTVGAVLAAVLLVLAHAGPGPMNPGPRGPGEMHGMILEHMKYRLELTEEQQEQIHGLMQAHHDQFASVDEEIREARGALFDAVHADTLDEGAIRDASAALAVLEADLAVARGGLFQQIRGVFTPDQQAEAAEMLSEMRAFREDNPGAKHHGGRHFRHHPGGLGRGR